MVWIQNEVKEPSTAVKSRDYQQQAANNNSLTADSADDLKNRQGDSRSRVQIPVTGHQTSMRYSSDPCKRSDSQVDKDDPSDSGKQVFDEHLHIPVDEDDYLQPKGGDQRGYLELVDSIGLQNKYISVIVFIICKIIHLYFIKFVFILYLLYSNTLLYIISYILFWLIFHYNNLGYE